jgi:hypothetical protein
MVQIYELLTADGAWRGGEGDGRQRGARTTSAGLQQQLGAVGGCRVCARRLVWFGRGAVSIDTLQARMQSPQRLRETVDLQLAHYTSPSPSSSSSGSMEEPTAHERAFRPPCPPPSRQAGCWLALRGRMGGDIVRQGLERARRAS